MAHPIPKARAPLAAALRGRGYKATDARLAILAYFTHHPRPLSARQVMEGIGAGADQSTVYRTIKSLAAKNLIRQVDLRHNHAHYELADGGEHHHLICTQCGRVEDVRHCDIEAMRRTVLAESKYFADIQQHSLEFYGHCKSCAKKESPREPTKEYGRDRRAV